MSRCLEPVHSALDKLCLAVLPWSNVSVGSQAVTSFCVSSKAGVIAAGCRNGAVYVWQFEGFRVTAAPMFACLAEWSGAASVVKCFFFPWPAPNTLGTQFPYLLGSHHSDGILRVWALDDGRCLYSLPTVCCLGSPAVMSAMLPDDRFLVLAAHTSIVVVDLWMRMTAAFLLFSESELSTAPLQSLLAVIAERYLSHRSRHWDCSRLTDPAAGAEMSSRSGLDPTAHPFVTKRDVFVTSLATNGESSEGHPIVSATFSDGSSMSWFLTLPLARWKRRYKFESFVPAGMPQNVNYIPPPYSRPTEAVMSWAAVLPEDLIADGTVILICPVPGPAEEAWSPPVHSSLALSASSPSVCHAIVSSESITACLINSKTISFHFGRRSKGVHEPVGKRLSLPHSTSVVDLPGDLPTTDYVRDSARFRFHETLSVQCGDLTPVFPRTCCRTTASDEEDFQEEFWVGIRLINYIDPRLWDSLHTQTGHSDVDISSESRVQSDSATIVSYSSQGRLLLSRVRKSSLQTCLLTQLPDDFIPSTSSDSPLPLVLFSRVAATPICVVICVSQEQQDQLHLLRFELSRQGSMTTPQWHFKSWDSTLRMSQVWRGVPNTDEFLTWTSAEVKGRVFLIGSRADGKLTSQCLNPTSSRRSDISASQVSTVRVPSVESAPPISVAESVSEMRPRHLEPSEPNKKTTGRSRRPVLSTQRLRCRARIRFTVSNLSQMDGAVSCDQSETVTDAEAYSDHLFPNAATITAQRSCTRTLSSSSVYDTSVSGTRIISDPAKTYPRKNVKPSRYVTCLLAVDQDLIVGGTSGGDVLWWHLPRLCMQGSLPGLHCRAVVRLMRLVNLIGFSSRLDMSRFASVDASGQILIIDTSSHRRNIPTVEDGRSRRRYSLTSMLLKQQVELSQKLPQNHIPPCSWTSTVSPDGPELEDAWTVNWSKNLSVRRRKTSAAYSDSLASIATGVPRIIRLPRHPNLVAEDIQKMAVDVQSNTVTVVCSLHIYLFSLSRSNFISTISLSSLIAQDALPMISDPLINKLPIPAASFFPALIAQSPANVTPAQSLLNNPITNSMPFITPGPHIDVSCVGLPFIANPALWSALPNIRGTDCGIWLGDLSLGRASVPDKQLDPNSYISSCQCQTTVPVILLPIVRLLLDHPDHHTQRPKTDSGGLGGTTRNNVTHYDSYRRVTLKPLPRQHMKPISIPPSIFGMFIPHCFLQPLKPYLSAPVLESLRLQRQHFCVGIIGCSLALSIPIPLSLSQVPVERHPLCTSYFISLPQTARHPEALRTSTLLDLSHSRWNDESSLLNLCSLDLAVINNIAPHWRYHPEQHGRSKEFAYAPNTLTLFYIFRLPTPLSDRAPDLITTSRLCLNTLIKELPNVIEHPPHKHVVSKKCRQRSNSVTLCLQDSDDSNAEEDFSDFLDLGESKAADLLADQDFYLTSLSSHPSLHRSNNSNLPATELSKISGYTLVISIMITDLLLHHLDVRSPLQGHAAPSSLDHQRQRIQRLLLRIAVRDHRHLLASALTFWTVLTLHPFSQVIRSAAKLWSGLFAACAMLSGCSAAVTEFTALLTASERVKAATRSACDITRTIVHVSVPCLANIFYTTTGPAGQALGHCKIILDLEILLVILLAEILHKRPAAAKGVSVFCPNYYRLPGVLYSRKPEPVTLLVARRLLDLTGPQHVPDLPMSLVCDLLHLFARAYPLLWRNALFGCPTSGNIFEWKIWRCDLAAQSAAADIAIEATGKTTAMMTLSTPDPSKPNRMGSGLTSQLPDSPNIAVWRVDLLHQLIYRIFFLSLKPQLAAPSVSVLLQIGRTDPTRFIRAMAFAARCVFVALSQLKSGGTTINLEVDVDRRYRRRRYCGFTFRPKCHRFWEFKISVRFGV